MWGLELLVLQRINGGVGIVGYLCKIVLIVGLCFLYMCDYVLYFSRCSCGWFSSKVNLGPGLLSISIHDKINFFVIECIF